MYDSIHSEAIRSERRVADRHPDLALSRDAALGLIRCADDDLPELLAAACDGEGSV